MMEPAVEGKTAKNVKDALGKSSLGGQGSAKRTLHHLHSREEDERQEELQQPVEVDAAPNQTSALQNLDGPLVIDGIEISIY
jgi:hypothetical protein